MLRKSQIGMILIITISLASCIDTNSVHKGKNKINKKGKTRKQFNTSNEPTFIESQDIEKGDGNKDVSSKLIQQSDFTYLGAFRLPNTTRERLKSRFPYGGVVLGFNPDGNNGKGSLFISGHDNHQLVAEITIPEARKTKQIKEMNTAELLQPFCDPTGGLKNKLQGSRMKLGGLCVEKKNLLWSLSLWYNVNATKLPTHGLSSLDLKEPDAKGVWNIGNIHNQKTGGYIFQVPEEWQEKFGYTLLTGASCLAGRETSSEGPAAFGYNPWESTSLLPHNGELKTTSFLWYKVTNRPVGVMNNQELKWIFANTIAGAVFPTSKDKSKSAIIYIARIGLHGSDWYGNSKDFPGPGIPCGEYRGYHGPPYKVTAWFYDPRDLLKVSKNKAAPWSVRPYLVVDLSANFFDKCQKVGGVTYDSSTSRIYIVEKDADLKGNIERWPIVHVYQLK